MQAALIANYKEKKAELKKRLEDFSKISKKEDIFYELCFCLLTPQSNAVKCDEAVKELRKKGFYKKSISIAEIRSILKGKTRFYKNKARYLLLAKGKFNEIWKELTTNNAYKAREYLARNVKGLGYKEASHFLRNIGCRNLAILDRHILKNLLKLGVISNMPRSLCKKAYLEIEGKFYKFSKKANIPMDELDLLFWSMETGKVFK
jgi:N-glycosylase/DNA lyase